MGHGEERVNGAGILYKRERAPPHWLNPLASRFSEHALHHFRERSTKACKLHAMLSDELRRSETTQCRGSLL